MKFEKKSNTNPTDKVENLKKRTLDLNNNIKLQFKFDKNKNSSNNNNNKYLKNEIMGLKFDEIDFDKEENAMKEFVIINLNKLLFLRNKVKKFSKYSRKDFLISSFKDIIEIKNQINKNTINDNDYNRNNNKRISNNINNKRFTLNEKNFNTRQTSTLKTNPNYCFKISGASDNFPKINNYLESNEINKNKIDFIEQNKSTFQLNESTNKHMNHSTNQDFFENFQNKSFELKKDLHINSISNNNLHPEKLVISDSSNTLQKHSLNNKISNEKNIHTSSKLQCNDIIHNIPSEIKTNKCKFFYF